MCGEHVYTADDVVHSKGSSPHVRGAPPCHLQSGHVHGIIPACAGSTVDQFVVGLERGDHPRMCGEHLTNFILSAGAAWIIPACAGSTLRK